MEGSKKFMTDILTKIEALADGYVTHDLVDIKVGDLKQLLAEYRTMAERLEQYDRMLGETVDMGLHCGSLEREPVTGIWWAYTDLNDEDRDLLPFDTALDAYKALTRETDADSSRS